MCALLSTVAGVFIYKAKIFFSLYSDPSGNSPSVNGNIRLTDKSKAGIRMVRYSDHATGHSVNGLLVRYSDHHLNNGLLVRYSDHRYLMIIIV